MSKAGNQPLTRKMRELIEARRRVREGPLPWDPPVWWWLSYSSRTAFLGAVVIEATTYQQAVTLAWNRGYAPSNGAPSGLILDPVTLSMTPDSYRNRLITPADMKALEALGHKFVTEADMEKEKADKEALKQDPLLQKAMQASEERAKSDVLVVK
jgi:hypothetical protein